MSRAHLAVIAAVVFVIAGCGNEQDTIAQLRAQVRSNPDSAETYIKLADAYMETEAYHDAFIQYSNAQRLQPDSFEATLGVAEAHERLNDVESAMEQVAAALQIRPDDPDALALRGKLLLRFDEHAEAASAFADALAGDPDNKVAHSLLPMAYLRTDRLEEAEQAARDALEVLSDSVEAHMNLATVLLARDKPDQAETLLRETMELDPADPIPPLRLAELLVRKGEKLDETIELADRSTELDPGEGEAEAVAALALRKQGRSEEAVRRLHGAAMAHPRNVRLWLMLASLYRELGEEEAAARAAGMAFRFAPRRRVRSNPVSEGEAPVERARDAADTGAADPTGAIPEDPADADPSLIPDRAGEAESGGGG